MRELPRQPTKELEVRQPRRDLDRLLLAPHVRASLEQIAVEQRFLSELSRNGIPPRRMLLFFGPPGNGKTVAAEALATMLDWPLYVARYDQITDSHVGQQTKNAVAMFEAMRGRKGVLFVDEADSLLASRTSVMQAADHENNATTNVVLQELDRLTPQVIFVAATNRCDDIDAAILRRFDEQIEFPRPSMEQREQFVRQLTDGMPVFKKHPRAQAAAMEFDAPSFAELQVQVINLARTLILKRCK